jgi:hypothetical protein
VVSGSRKAKGRYRRRREPAYFLVNAVQVSIDARKCTSG